MKIMIKGTIPLADKLVSEWKESTTLPINEKTS